MPNVKATFTADISQFRRSLAEATSVVTAFDRTTGQVNSALKRFANEFSGARVQREAETMAKAIQQIGGAAKLSDAELKKAGATLQEYIAKSKRMGTEVPKDMQRLADYIAKVGKETEKTTSLMDRMGGFGSSVLSGLGVGVGFNIAEAVGSGLRDLAALGAQLSPIQAAFTNLSGGAGQATARLDALREATRGLVSDFDLMQAANKGSLLGLDAMGIDMAELAQVATRLGRAMGQDASKSVDDLTTALSRMSPQILDNLGIKVSLTEANEKYARSIGKSADALTDEEKKLAFATAAMDAARQKAATLGEQSLTTADNLTRIGSSATNLVASLGAAANESGILSAAVGVVADGVDELGVNLSTVRQEFADAFAPLQRLVDLLGTAASNSQILGEALRVTVAPGLNALNLALKGTAEQLDRIAAIREAVTGTLGDVNLTLPGRDVTLADRTGGQHARAQQWLDDEIARLQKQYMADQDAALRKIEEGGKKAAKATKELTDAQRDLNTQAAAAFTFATQAGQGWEEYAGGVQLARMEMEAVIAMQADAVIGARQMAMSGLMMTGPYQYQISGNMTAGVLNGTAKAAKATKDWRIELQGVAQAFANLSQVAGKSFDGVSRTIGTAIASANAGMELVKSLAGIFGGLQTADGKQTRAGAALAGGVSGIGIGSQLGSMIPQSRWGAFAAGAGGGALTGGMATGWNPYGIAAGAAIGGISAVLTSGAMAHAQNKAKDLELDKLIAQFGTLDELLHVADGLGLDQEGLLKKLWGDPEAFAEGVSELNAALTKERQEVDRLSKSLDAAAKAQGILSRADMAALAALRKGGPGDEMRQQFIEGQTGQLVGGLTSLLQSGTLTPDIVGSAGVALGAAFTLMKQQGLSVKQILESLGPALDAFRERAVNAGLGSTEQFDNLARMLDVLRGPMGAVIDAAHGAGSALAALANTGMISQDMFGGLAKSITDAYKTLERNGQGGTQAVLMLQGPLQNIWQLMKDFGLQVDDETKGLIDFAEEAGLIGEDFRPATEKMVDALDKLIERMDTLLGLFAQAAGFEWPTPETPGLPGGGDPGVTYPENPFPMASGGLVTRPTRALIGEAGPEAVIPLNRLRSMSGGGIVEIVTPVVVDGREIARVSHRYSPSERRLLGVA